MKMFGVTSACVLALLVAGGCSSSSKTTTPSTVAPSATSTPRTLAYGVVPISVTACSLATPDQVNALVGAKPTGVESDSSEVYKTCTWSSGSGVLAVGVIRLGGGQLGFYGKKVGLTAVDVPGFGDKATYSTGKNSNGRNEALLVANRGTASVSVDASYAGTNAPPASAEDSLKSIAAGVFTQMGA